MTLTGRITAIAYAPNGSTYRIVSDVFRCPEHAVYEARPVEYPDDPKPTNGRAVGVNGKAAKAKVVGRGGR